FDLKLRYVLLRIKEDEIRQQFVYFGKTRKKDFVDSEEGELHWIPMDIVKNTRVSKIISFMLDHYFENPDINDVMIGTITRDEEEQPKIQWSELKDPRVF